MVKIILKKWEIPPMLKKCKFLKVRDTKTKEEKNYIYKAKLEKSVIDKGSDGKPFFEIINFLDKDFNIIEVNIEEVLKHEYVEKKPKEKTKAVKTGKEAIKVIKKSIGGEEKEKKKTSRKEAKDILGKEFGVEIPLAAEDFFTKHIEGKNEGKIKSFTPKKMADFILKKYKFKVIKGNDKQIYFYEGGYYKENGIALIRKITTDILKDLFKEYYVNETISYIRNLNYVESDEINKEWINLKNGLLNPITKEFKEHTPDIFCLNQLPINYDTEATCTNFKENLKKRCDLDWKYDLIQEMFGYSLLGDNRYEKAFLLYGERRTTKSTTLYVLENLIGEKNVTSMSLQQITEDKHAPAFLLDSMANICAELSPKELKNTNMFMKIVGRDKITAGKKFEQEITFAPTTKLIFSCNTIPSTTNKNLAFYRRWCVIEFNIQTEEEDVDPLMREKLLEELSGVLNWALEGLKRILEQNKLSYPLNDEETRDLYEKGSDSVQSFIFNCVDCENDEGGEKKRVIYKKYQEYCKENKLDIENQFNFGRRFIALSGCGSKRIGQIPGYAGISLKDKKSEQVTLRGEK